MTYEELLKGVKEFLGMAPPTNTENPTDAEDPQKSKTEKEFSIEEFVLIPTHKELEEAIQNNTLHEYSLHQITQSALQVRHGSNFLHVAAENNVLDKLPKEILTEKNLLTKDKDGNTCLHIAAIYGSLYQIPKEVINLKNLLLKTKPSYSDPSTVIEAAALKGYLRQIPLEFLTVDTLAAPEKHSALQIAASNGKLNSIPLLPIPTLSKIKNRYENNKGDKERDRILEWVDQKIRESLFFHDLKKLPEEDLTADLLMEENKYGEKTILWIAKNNNLEMLPFLPRKTLTELEDYFKENTTRTKYKEEILEFLKERIKEINMNSIKRSCKIDHLPVI
jgi:ankyrin repeat protein